MRHSVRAMLFSVLAFSVVNVLVKLLPNVPLMEVVFMRAIVSLLMCLVQLNHQKVSVWGVNKKILLLRGFCGATALSLLFFSIRSLPLGTAVTIQYLNPLFVVLLSSLLLGEKSTIKQWSFFVLAFIGVVLIQGGLSEVGSWIVPIAVLGAAISALAYICIRVLKNTEHELVIIFYFPLIVILLFGPFVLWNWYWPTLLEWVGLVLIGLATQVGQVFLTRAYSSEPASRFIVINYLGVLIALVFGKFLFGESLSPYAYVGIVLIVLSALLAQTPWANRPTNS